MGIQLEDNDRWHVYAPHGLADVFDLVVRPNPPPLAVTRRDRTHAKDEYPCTHVPPMHPRQHQCVAVPEGCTGTVPDIGTRGQETWAGQYSKGLSRCSTS
ncbi:nucleotidyltransferase family protein [Lentzea kentuckyensis]|uniref:nucleotidyltransferase family protein n=1 Tax=Lentzea kentuckyensis TaxID=360086 RepID=UPI002481AEB2|nr:nucleotidyltransferase family protein [Lentzea kentuckyensis]